MRDTSRVQKPAFFRMRDLTTLFGLCRSSIHGRVKTRLIPPPVRIGVQAVAWPAEEIHRLIAAQIAGHNDDLIRALVIQLVKDRQGATQ